jgi:hypothetical protein
MHWVNKIYKTAGDFYTIVRKNTILVNIYVPMVVQRIDRIHTFVGILN